MCQQCEALNINGVPYHEIGCLDDWLHAWTSEPLPRLCHECGRQFRPDNQYQYFCDDNCKLAYHSLTT